MDDALFQERELDGSARVARYALDDSECRRKEPGHRGKGSSKPSVPLPTHLPPGFLDGIKGFTPNVAMSTRSTPFVQVRTATPSLRSPPPPFPWRLPAPALGTL